MKCPIICVYGEPQEPEAAGDVSHTHARAHTHSTFMLMSSLSELINVLIREQSRPDPTRHLNSVFSSPVSSLTCRLMQQPTTSPGRQSEDEAEPTTRCHRFNWYRKAKSLSRVRLRSNTNSSESLVCCLTLWRPQRCTPRIMTPQWFELQTCWLLHMKLENQRFHINSCSSVSHSLWKKKLWLNIRKHYHSTNYLSQPIRSEREKETRKRNWLKFILLTEKRQKNAAVLIFKALGLISKGE